jgi:hypothetical protein
VDSYLFSAILRQVFLPGEEVIQEGQAGIDNWVPDASERTVFHMSDEKQCITINLNQKTKRIAELV